MTQQFRTVEGNIMVDLTYEPGPRLRRLLTLDETAEALRRTPVQLRSMVQQRKAPRHAKIAGRLMWDADEVAEWIDAHFAEAS